MMTEEELEIVSELIGDDYPANQELDHRIRTAIIPQDRGVMGIGGRNKVTGTETEKMPFPNIRLIIYFNFLLMQGKIASLLCVKDMINIGQDISLQKHTITHNGSTQKDSLENFFFVYWCSPK